MAVEVADVDQAAAVFAAQVAEVKGRQIDARSERDRNGRVTAHLVYEVPLATAAGVVERFKAAGTVRAFQSVRDPQAADGRFATARIHVTLSNECQNFASYGSCPGSWTLTVKGPTLSWVASTKVFAGAFMISARPAIPFS